MPLKIRIWVAVGILLLAFGYHRYVEANTFYSDEPNSRSRFVATYQPAAILDRYGYIPSAFAGGSSSGWREHTHKDHREFWTCVAPAQFEELSAALRIHLESSLKALGEKFEVERRNGQYIYRYAGGNHRGTITLEGPEAWPWSNACGARPTSRISILISEISHK